MPCRISGKEGVPSWILVRSDAAKAELPPQFLRPHVGIPRRTQVLATLARYAGLAGHDTRILQFLILG